MKQILLRLMIVLGLALLPAAAVPSTAYAACNPDSSSKGQVIKGIGETGSNCSGQGVVNIVATIVNVLSFVIGIAAIIVVIYAGLKYITSGGEAGKISNAKNTLVYALIGLAIAALAQFLVHFVLTQASNATKKKRLTQQTPHSLQIAQDVTNNHALTP